MATATAPERADRVAPHHRFTVQQYHELIEIGALGENDKVELINGELRDKMPIGDNHVDAVRRLNRHFQRRLGDRAVVGVQDPVTLPQSEPEPDLALLHPRVTGKALAADTLLIIEVADSSEHYDRAVKGPMYAEAGIPEYWLVCLSTDTVEVRRRPTPAGGWEDVRIVRRGESLAPGAFPDAVIAMDELLPPGD